MAERWRILLVQSNPATQQALADAFRQQGWETRVASDATSALALARQATPDLVVLDAELVGSGALIILKRLRASAATATTPILLTGTPTPAQRAQLQEGAQARLERPEESEVVAAIRAQLAAPAPEVKDAPAEALQHPLRLAALRASGLLDTPPEVAFDRITHLVSRLLGAPTALLTLVDKDRQFFKSQVGLPEPAASDRQTPLSHSFCQWVVCGREPVTVNDAREHRTFQNNPAIRDLGVVAYTGVPIFSLQGEALGSLCAIDAKPHAWQPHDIDVLHDLARIAESGVARAALQQHPPKGAQDFDPYVEAAGSAVGAILRLLRRDDCGLDDSDRELLYDMVEEYSNHLVQLNRLIQVNQVLG